MTATNELYEDMARRRGHRKWEVKIEVWRSRVRGQGSGVKGQESEIERRLAEARREDAEWEQLVRDGEDGQHTD